MGKNFFFTRSRKSRKNDFIIGIEHAHRTKDQITDFVRLYTFEF